jgi:hypothetical protein
MQRRSKHRTPIYGMVRPFHSAATCFFRNTLSGYIGLLYEKHILTSTGFFWFLTLLGLVTGLAIWAFSKPLNKAIDRH